MQAPGFQPWRASLAKHACRSCAHIHQQLWAACTAPGTANAPTEPKLEWCMPSGWAHQSKLHAPSVAGVNSGYSCRCRRLHRQQLRQHASAAKRGGAGNHGDLQGRLPRGREQLAHCGACSLWGQYPGRPHHSAPGCLPRRQRVQHCNRCAPGCPAACW